VVEFEYKGNPKTGLIYPYLGKINCAYVEDDEAWGIGSTATRKTVFHKIGRVDFIPDRSCCCGDFEDEAVAYFAKTPQVTPQESSEAAYKVGDLVEVKHGGEWLTAVVIGIDKGDANQPYDVRFKDGDGYYPVIRCIRPLSGTYAERQAKWIEFHGLKVGDKVKVVRKFKDDEDGYNGYCFDNKHLGQVGSYLSCLTKGGLKLDGLQSPKNDSRWLPYFALEPVK
jgi:hypothetical protein